MNDKITRVDEDHVPRRTRNLYMTASLIALVGNVVLLVAKAAAARVSGSSAIYADAANSAADVAYSVLMGLGLWMSLRPPDLSHPHGHRRFEPLVSIAIGVMMALAGVEAARTGIRTWGAGPQPITSLWAIIAPLGTVAAKAGMYVVVERIGRKAGSPALLASSRDNLNDAFSSLAALAGILVSRFLTAAGDPVAALLVSLWIFRGAYLVLRESIGHITGVAASPELTHDVMEAAQSVSGVLGVHQVIVEYVGPQVRADLHIDMEGSSSLDHVHEVSDAVRSAVESLAEVDHAFVHVEPIEEPNGPPDLAAEAPRVIEREGEN
ncbi:MAG: cation diffusion facilitator family transporter [Anaerolineae bacterium]